MDYSTKRSIALRRFGRRLGILRPLVNVWRRYSNYQYEENFNRALFAQIVPGDIIWDIGANIGYYTRLFANAVGPNGTVMAFEPSPITAESLMSAMKDFSNVQIRQVALSDYSGDASFYYDPKGGNPVDGLSPSVAKSEAKIAVHRGDEFLASYPPSMIKIDVEGYEYEVLCGMQQTLRSPTLRSVLVEVHFKILTQRGKPNAPSDIVALLRNEKFRVNWTDSSHIAAVRDKTN